VGGTGVAVGGIGVAVGGMGVAVGGIGVAVGGTGVAVGMAVGVSSSPLQETAANNSNNMTRTYPNFFIRSAPFSDLDTRTNYSNALTMRVLNPLFLESREHLLL
jgi:hypothetical protein